MQINIFNNNICILPIIITILILSFLLLVIWIIYTNICFETKRYILKLDSKKDDISKKYNGFKIAHISDLHGSTWGR